LRHVGERRGSATEWPVSRTSDPGPRTARRASREASRWALRDQNHLDASSVHDHRGALVVLEHERWDGEDRPGTTWADAVSVPPLRSRHLTETGYPLLRASPHRRAGVLSKQTFPALCRARPPRPPTGATTSAGSPWVCLPVLRSTSQRSEALMRWA